MRPLHYTNISFAYRRGYKINWELFLKKSKGSISIFFLNAFQSRKPSALHISQVNAAASEKNKLL